MPFRKFVEIGRVAYAVNGPAKGKLLVIVDVIDYNRALVEGPCTGVPRQEYRFINLQLTKYKINIQHGQHTKHVTKAWDEAKIGEQWKKSVWAQAVQKRKTRESLNDYDRFKVARLKKARNRLVHLTYKTLVQNKKTKKIQKVVKRKKVERDPVKRKLKQKMNNLYTTLRKKGVFKTKAKKAKKAKKGEKKQQQPKAPKVKKAVKKTVALKKAPSAKAVTAPAKSKPTKTPATTKPGQPTKKTAPKTKKAAAK